MLLLKTALAALVAGLAFAELPNSNLNWPEYKSNRYWYADTFYLANEVKNPKIEDGHYIGRNWDIQKVLTGKALWDKIESGKALLARNDVSKDCAIAIRGTDKTAPIDIIRDMDTTAVPFEIEGTGNHWPPIMWVHQGFLKRFNELIGPKSGGNHDHYYNFVKKCCADGYHIVYTGHSLGGAVAWLAGQGLFYNRNWRNPAWNAKCPRKKMYAITFGQPRVMAAGQKCPSKGGVNVSISTRRFVMGKGQCQVDIVPQIPPCTWFCEGATFIAEGEPIKWDGKENSPSWAISNIRLHSRKRYAKGMQQGLEFDEYMAHKGGCVFKDMGSPYQTPAQQAEHVPVDKCKEKCTNYKGQHAPCVAFASSKTMSGNQRCTIYFRESATTWDDDQFTKDWNVQDAVITASELYCYRRKAPDSLDGITEYHEDAWEWEVTGAEPADTCPADSTISLAVGADDFTSVGDSPALLVGDAAPAPTAGTATRRRLNHLTFSYDASTPLNPNSMCKVAPTLQNGDPPAEQL